MKKGYIYTLSCPNSGLVRYVGQTINLRNRYNLHLYHSKNGKARTHKEKWINTLLNTNKKPVLEIIWEGAIELLDKKESEFILLFKSIGAKLTNATLGGLTTRGRKCSDETREKMRQLMSGRCSRPPITDAEKISISIRSKGVIASEETRKKISDSRKGKPSHWTFNKMPVIYRKRIAETGRLCSKKIIASKDGKEVLYNSTVEAERETGCDRKTMRQVANGIYKQCKGYKFKFSQS